MGQVESVATSGDDRSRQAPAPAPAPPPEPEPQPAPTAAEPSSSPAASSMEALIAEATDFGDGDENESLDAKAQRALECPCVAELRKGPCGTQFSEAFVCFIKSTSKEKGSDCVAPFLALQDCIRANPEAFSKDVLEEESIEEEDKVQDHKIIPPSWSREPKPKI